MKPTKIKLTEYQKLIMPDKAESQRGKQTTEKNHARGVVTKTRNGMEQKGQFHSVVFRILRPEAIDYISLNPKNFDLGIPNQHVYNKIRAF